MSVLAAPREASMVRARLLLLSALLAAATNTAAVAWADVGFSGSYQVTVGARPRFVMVIDQPGSTGSFTLSGAGVAISGSTAVTGMTLTIAASLGGSDVLSGAINFAPGFGSFSGTWELTSAIPSQGTMTGTRTPWATYDVDSLGLPRLATSDCIELAKIQKISRLRSGEGHDYSDEFESCRSMKHYYFPRDGVERSSIRLFSPVAGTVIGTTDEWEGSGLAKGTTVGIQPTGWPAFVVILFHIDLGHPLLVGDLVAAGQELGASAKTSGTVTDLAVGVHTPGGYRLVSFFEVASHAVFSLYLARGIDSPADMIITRAARDADPLGCQGETFLSTGTLENWVTLLDGRRPHPIRRRLRPID